MKLGTKSLLFGCHQFLIHPLTVALAWWKLYGFPTDLRLWFAFFLHDIGYYGCAEMDGPEGKLHPELGAAIMGSLFGKKWWTFTISHSRHYCKLYELEPSKLCWADKYSVVYMPSFLYKFLGRATGELSEYMEDCGYDPDGPSDTWINDYKQYIKDLVNAETSTNKA